MKKKSIIYLLLALMIACLALAGCGGGSGSETMTLESWMAEHPDELEALSADGMEVSVEGNTLFYTYDASMINGLAEETALSDAFKKAMDDTIDDSAEDVIGEITTLEEKSGVDGITGTVVCKFKDKVITEKSFTKDSSVPEKETNDGMTLEQWMAEHPEHYEGLKAQENENAKYSFEGNYMIIKYEFQPSEQVTEEYLFSEDVRNSLEEGLAGNEDDFIKMIDGYEQLTGIDDITLKIIYHCNDKVILEKDYTN